MKWRSYEKDEVVNSAALATEGNDDSLLLVLDQLKGDITSQVSKRERRGDWKRRNGVESLVDIDDPVFV